MGRPQSTKAPKGATSVTARKATSPSMTFGRRVVAMGRSSESRYTKTSSSSPLPGALGHLAARQEEHRRVRAQVVWIGRKEGARRAEPPHRQGHHAPEEMVVRHRRAVLHRAGARGRPVASLWGAMSSRAHRGVEAAWKMPMVSCRGASDARSGNSSGRAWWFHFSLERRDRSSKKPAGVKLLQGTSGRAARRGSSSDDRVPSGVEARGLSSSSRCTRRRWRRTAKAPSSFAGAGVPRGSPAAAGRRSKNRCRRCRTAARSPVIRRGSERESLEMFPACIAAAALTAAKVAFRRWAPLPTASKNC